MSIGRRFLPILSYLPQTIILLLVSRILFDLLAGREMFWNSREGIETLLWHSVIGGPFILFALLVAAQRQGIGK